MAGRPLGLIVAVAGAGSIALGTFLLHAGGPPPAPPAPAPAEAPEKMMNTELKYSPTVYRAMLEDDAGRFGVPVPKVEQIQKVNAYFDEWKGRRKLKAKVPFETKHLRMRLEVARHEATLDGQRYAADHLVLRIENRTNKHLAYLVETSVGDKHKCASKGDIPHNALVLEPNQALSRSECLYRADEAVELRRVQIMELQPLSAYYLSRLPPSATLADARTSAGHMPLKGELCPQTFSWREIREGADAKELGWRDIVDFYARHNCDEYAFFRGYRYRTDASASLPARPID